MTETSVYSVIHSGRYQEVPRAIWRPRLQRCCPTSGHPRVMRGISCLRTPEHMSGWPLSGCCRPITPPGLQTESTLTKAEDRYDAATISITGTRGPPPTANQ